MTQCLTTGCERDTGPSGATDRARWTHCSPCENRIIEDAKAWGDIKHAITVLSEIGVQKFLDENPILAQTIEAPCQDCYTPWPHPGVLSDRPLCPSCRFQRERDLKEEIKKLEAEIELCPADSYHTQEPKK